MTQINIVKISIKNLIKVTIIPSVLHLLTISSYHKNKCYIKVSFLAITKEVIFIIMGEKHGITIYIILTKIWKYLIIAKNMPYQKHVIIRKTCNYHKNISLCQKCHHNRHKTCYHVASIALESKLLVQFTKSSASFSHGSRPSSWPWMPGKAEVKWISWAAGGTDG